MVADAPSAIRVLETSQPPAYYVDPRHVNQSLLSPSRQRGTLCEWKGVASYAHATVLNETIAQGAWTYQQPTAAFAAIEGRWAFYAQKFEECWVDDERVVPNEGGFYGGWITANVTGPFKGAPGTAHW
jgi:uncharacterized protein (DUF427 family)